VTLYWRLPRFGQQKNLAQAGKRSGKPRSKSDKIAVTIPVKAPHTPLQDNGFTEEQIYRA